MRVGVLSMRIEHMEFMVPYFATATSMNFGGGIVGSWDGDGGAHDMGNFPYPTPLNTIREIDGTLSGDGTGHCLAMGPNGCEQP